MRLLVVEDQPELAETIGDYLELQGHEVDFAFTGESALGLVEDIGFDAILLDINLPRRDGLSVCNELRAAGNSIPILMMTARDTLDDIVAGFDGGADDYLVKPFALEELMVRLRAITVRGRRKDTGTISVADLQLDLLHEVATRQGITLKLNALQFQLLKALVLASPGVVARETLESNIWRDEPPQSGALRMHILRLRNAVDQDFDHSLIETVHGRGFRLVG